MFRYCVVFLFCYQSLFAYLDPSTGSLLLSSLVALFASIIFFIKSIYYKLLNFLSIKKISKNDIEKCGLIFYSEGGQYYGVFAPILDVLDEWGYPYLFLTSDKEDPAMLREQGQKVRFIGEKNRAYAHLNTLDTDLLVMTTPGLDVLQIKKTKRIKHYSHIVHSLRSPNYRVFGLDYYDSVLINSQIQEDFIREIESKRQIVHKDIINVGSTYCDFLYKLKEEMLKENKITFFPNRCDKKVVLLSPSWGKEGILSKYGMKIITPILKAGFLLIIRPHPQSLIVEKDIVQKLQEQTIDNSQVVWDIGTPNVYAMHESDVMISDFSGVIFDYLCLYEKPILTLDFSFCHFEYDSLDVEVLWELSVLDRIGGRVSLDNIHNISNLITQALENRTEKEEICKIKTLLWSYPHQSGRRAASALLQIRKNILEDSLSDIKEIYQNLLKTQEILRSHKC